MGNTPKPARPAKLYLFVDTNVFLHYKYFDHVNWRECADADELVLTLCLTVHKELDDKKRVASTQKRARSVLRKINELTRTANPVRLSQPGHSLWVLGRYPRKETYELHELDPLVKDERVLADMYEQAKRDSSVPVGVLAADSALLTSARMRGFGSFAPPDDWLEEKVDEIEKENRALRKKLTEIQAASPNLRVTNNGTQRFTIEVPRLAPLTEEQVETALAKVRERHKELAPPTYQSTSRIVFMPSLLTEDAVRSYNRERLEYFKASERYLRRLPLLFEPAQRTIELSLRLENDGNQVGDDVHIILAATAEGVWLDEEPKVDGPPEPPKPPESPLDSLTSIGQMSHALRLAEQIDWARDTDDDALGPNITAEGREARFRVEIVKPELPVELPKVYFQFASFDDVKPFSIRYRLHARNLPRPAEGAIHVLPDVVMWEAEPDLDQMSEKDGR